MNQNSNRSYSFLDPELPLLAVDAAYEIDDFLASTDPSSSASLDSDLKISNELINRLKKISSSNQSVTADNELFCKSLLPQMAIGKISLPTDPVSLNTKLLEIMQSSGSTKSSIDLQNVRDFFITISDFSMNAQRWSRSGI